MPLNYKGFLGPAIILKVVLFPHPEGPSITTNSLCSILRLIPRTASVLSNFFWRFFNSILDISRIHSVQIFFMDLSSSDLHVLRFFSRSRGITRRTFGKNCFHSTSQFQSFGLFVLGLSIDFLRVHVRPEFFFQFN